MAGLIAHRLGFRIPSTWCFIGDLRVDGKFASHAAGAGHNFDLTFETLQQLADAGVEHLAVSADLRLKGTSCRACGWWGWTTSGT